LCWSRAKSARRPDRYRRGGNHGHAWRECPVDKTDWSPLAGKSVLIWPDRDAPGWDYADRASQAILNAGATTVAILVPPDDKPDGWDAADAIPEGFDVGGFLAVGERMPVMRSVEETPPPDLLTGVDWTTRTAVLGLHPPLWRGLALLRAVGQMAGLDGRALESRSDPLRISPGARHLPDGLAPGGQPRLKGKLASSATISSVEKIARSDRSTRPPPRSGMPILGAQHPGRRGRSAHGPDAPHRRDDRMTKSPRPRRRATARRGARSWPTSQAATPS
jgi:putative DNA primase/helicase